MNNKLTRGHQDEAVLDPILAPIFAGIFGSKWAQMPPVMHDHYAIRSRTNDLVIATGVMAIQMSFMAKLMAPFFKLTGTLVPRAGDNVKVTVRFTSGLSSDFMCFDRSFTFADGRTERFLSKMEPVGGNQIIEWTGSGIGWRAAFTYENDKVCLSHKGYAFKLFGKIIPLPISWLFGYGNASEVATSDTGFDMEMTLAHPVWGMIYGYNGHFEITEISLDE